MKVKPIQKYINLYSHKIAIQNALWQRYKNSRLFLGVNKKVAHDLLAYAIAKFGA